MVVGVEAAQNAATAETMSGTGNIGNTGHGAEAFSLSDKTMLRAGGRSLNHVTRDMQENLRKNRYVFSRADEVSWAEPISQWQSCA